MIAAASSAAAARRRVSGAFFTTYLRRSVRGGLRHIVIVALGLAVGVAAVVSLTAASTGVSRAQSAVLHSLYGLSTDITVTTAAPTSGSGNGQGNQGSQGLIGAGDAGTTQFRLPPGLGLLDASAVTSIAKLPGVATVAAGLSVSETVVGAAPKPGGLPTLTTTRLDGVDVAHLKLGPFASGSIAAGRSFAAGDASADVAVVDSGHAAAHQLHVGSTITIGRSPFTVVGIVKQGSATNEPEAYIPLARAQAVSSQGDKVNAIYVSASGPADVTAMRAKIEALLPHATVTSSSDLAGRVNGSLSSAAKLVTNLGRWIAIAMLALAFGLAVLLTTAAVRRRVREFGTLKALGWRTPRIVAQIMSESFVTGVIGAVLGVGLGAAGAAVIQAVAPDLTAVVTLNPGSTAPQGAIINGGTLKTLTLPGGVQTVAVHMHAAIGVTQVLLAVGLAVGGAVLAGALGSWRAARLRPSHALSRVT